MRATHALPDGTQVREYVILSLLGAGTFGIVYKCRHRFTEQIVAVKEYFPEDSALRIDGIAVEPRADPEATATFEMGRKKFLDEARTLVHLTEKWEASRQGGHPNFVKVRNYTEDNGTAYVYMEFVEGTPLSDILLQHGTLSFKKAARYLYGLMNALERVHQANILHRDIKPQNIIIQPKDTPVLIDFGAARREFSSPTRSAVPIYTPLYAAPEQYRQGMGQQGAWTDIYALAATFYEAVTGNQPINAGIRIDENQPMSAVDNGANGFPRYFLEALDWALNIPTNKRPQSVHAWRTAFKGGRTLADPSSIPAPPPAPGPRRLPWVIVASLLLILLVPKSPPRYEPLPPLPPELEPFSVIRDTLKTGDVGPAMVVIPAGHFVMGSPSSEKGRQPNEFSPASVTIERPFAIGARELSIDHYRQFKEATADTIASATKTRCWHYDPDEGKLVVDPGLAWRKPGYDASDSHPVTCVSWDDARAYAAWLSMETDQVYRLPSELEWEYAARAGISSSRYWGEGGDPALVCEHANVWACAESDTTIAPTGDLRPNKYGLHDMLGNVAEWTCSAYTSRPSLDCDRQGIPTTKRVFRGGSCCVDISHVRAAGRDGWAASEGQKCIGFRLVRELHYVERDGNDFPPTDAPNPVTDEATGRTADAAHACGQVTPRPRFSPRGTKQS